MKHLTAVVLTSLFVASVALVSYGVGMIYVPAGVITAGLSCGVLGWLFAVEADE